MIGLGFAFFDDVIGDPMNGYVAESSIGF